MLESLPFSSGNSEMELAEDNGDNGKQKSGGIPDTPLDIGSWLTGKMFTAIPLVCLAPKTLPHGNENLAAPNHQSWPARLHMHFGESDRYAIGPQSGSVIRVCGYSPLL